MINRVVLVGRLTKNPDLRYTQSGSAVASFTVAVERPFTNQNGDRDADFINCVMWRKAAENFANFTHKGSMVAVEGRLQTRSYENQQGVRVYVTEVVVDNFSLLETKAQSEQYRREHPEEAQGQGAPMIIIHHLETEIRLGIQIQVETQTRVELSMECPNWQLRKRK